MEFEKLCRENAKQYIEYLKAAMEKEPEMMTAEVLDEEGILKRLEDPFYGRTTSVLAMDGECVVGRIEYHFYGCMQDGARMAYVDWVYVLPEWRRKGVAQQLFARFEEDCVAHEIDQYYLIRATNPAADRFYHHFENAELSETPLLRKMCQKEHVQGLECVAFHDPDRREGRDEGHAPVAQMCQKEPSPLAQEGELR